MGTQVVRDVMSREVETIEPGEPVSRAAERLVEEDVGLLAVCEAGDRLSAVITGSDIVARIAVEGIDPEGLTAGECGTREPATVAPSETLEEAARRMDEQHVWRLPVVQAGRLVGLVARSDLAAHEAGPPAEGPRTAGGELGELALAPLIEAGPSIYLAGFLVGIAIAALALLQFGASI